MIKYQDIGKQKRDSIATNPIESGDALFSRSASREVPSAMRSLTAVFGMCTGGSFSLLSPEIAECTLVHSQLHIYL